MLYFQAIPNYSAHKHICVCVCDECMSIAVWCDTLWLLSPWWIAKCSYFKILLRHSHQPAEGVWLMYCFSWDWVCACASFKVCNKCTYKRQQGFFVCVWKQVVQRKRNSKEAFVWRYKIQPVMLTLLHLQPALFWQNSVVQLKHVNW